MPPKNLNVWSLEEKRVLLTLKYLFEMRNLDKKITLCAILQNLKSKPLDYSDVMVGKFLMDNGQHSIKVSKKMKDIPNAEKKF